MKKTSGLIVIVVLSILVDAQNETKANLTQCHQCAAYSEPKECNGTLLELVTCNNETDRALLQTLKRLFPFALLPGSADIPDTGQRDCVMFKRDLNSDYYERRGCVFPAFKVCDIEMGPNWSCYQCQENACNQIIVKALSNRAVTMSYIASNLWASALSLWIFGKLAT